MTSESPRILVFFLPHLYLMLVCGCTTSQPVKTRVHAVESPEERVWKRCISVDRERRTSVCTTYEVVYRDTKTVIEETINGRVTMSGGPVSMLEGAATGKVRLVNDNTTAFFNEMKATYREYLSTYPQGKFSEQARTRIRELEERESSRKIQIKEAVKNGRVQVMRL